MVKNEVLVNRICVLVFICCLSFCETKAQLCTGSLGDPVVKLDFGTGTSSHGAALGSGITSYTYTTANFPNDGSYTIEKATNTAGTWWTTTDHTGGGYMMVVNASFSTTDYFYKNTVTGLCPGTTYEFAAWIMNLLVSRDNSPPNITFTIEDTSGTILGTYNTGDIGLSSSATWKQYGFYFTTPSGISTVVIRMRNNKAGAAPGNDIALDDITFRACGPTVTSAIQNESTTNLQLCENDSKQITLTGSVSSSAYTAVGYQWQASIDGGTSWNDISGANFASYTFTSGAAGTYKYRLATADASNISSTNCRVFSNEINIVVKTTAGAPTGNTSQSFCSTQNATIGDLRATGTAIVWYDLVTNGTVLDASTPLVNGATYYASQTLNGCESINRLAVEVEITNPIIDANDVTASFCDDANDGIEVVDLTSYQSSMTADVAAQVQFYTSQLAAQTKDVTAQITVPTQYNLKTGTTVLYARIGSNDNCFQVVSFTLTLYGESEIAIDDEVALCENSAVIVDAGAGFESYLWSTSETSQTIEISETGNYWVTVTKNNGDVSCLTIKNFEVYLSNVATISSIDIVDWTDNQNAITINLVPNGHDDYEYSVDGYNYQDSNVFYGLLSGAYTVYVRNKYGCGEVTKVVYILNYPKFFTPNGDGYNDTWAVKLSETEANLKTRIFDRYGKFLKELTSTGAWDGTYAGHQLPSDDYWFEVFRQDEKIYRGHFSLKR